MLKEAGDAAVLEPADAREAVLAAAEGLLAPSASVNRRAAIRMTDEEARAFLDEQRTVICATNGHDGLPHLMPLWYVVRGGTLWAWTYAKSQKAKNLERDPRATLQVETGDAYEELRGLMLRTEAVLHRDADGARASSTSSPPATRRRAPTRRRCARASRAQVPKRVAIEFAEVGRVSLGPPQARRHLLALLGWPAMEQLKGLILSGGRGTRLRPITYTSAKQLVPVANKPVLFYGIEAMAAAGIREIGIIIAPETGDEIREAAGDGSQFGVRDHLRRPGRAGRARARGAHRRAVPRRLAVRDVPRRQPAPGRHARPRAGVPRARARRADPAHAGAGPARTTASPSSTARASVTRLAEKPPEPATDLALVGVYMFTPLIHEAARAIQPSPRGELEITDAIQWLVDGGRRVESHIVRGWWKDTGRLDDMLEANRLILETIDRHVDGELDDSQVDGRVIVEAGARLERSTVRGPAIIGAGAVLRDAYVGPYTAVGRHCVIESAEVEHSILLEGSSVRGLDGRMESSLLGRDVHDLPRRPPAARLPLHGRRQLGDRDPLGLQRLAALTHGIGVRREREGPGACRSSAALARPAPRPLAGVAAAGGRARRSPTTTTSPSRSTPRTARRRSTSTSTSSR